MLKAGSLYFSIVIAFLIAVISASFMMLATHYRNTYLKEIRHAKLRRNLNSGIIYALADDSLFTGHRSIDLFADQTDSLMITKKQWGAFELVTLAAFIQTDTLKQAFLVGNQTDSTALYLADEDRPLSISGNTKITGNVSIPKSGMRKAYVDGKAYLNKELIYHGKIDFSERKLVPLNLSVLKGIKENLKGNKTFPMLNSHERYVSFLDSVQQFKLPKIAELSDVKLKGNIILFSDSIVNIAASAQLDGIQIYAPIINVANNFKGNCQLYALDSIVVGSDVNFNFPSVIAIVSLPQSESQSQIRIGENLHFDGILLSCEEERSPLQTLISLGRKTAINGEIYVNGLLKFENDMVVNGKVACNTFVMRSKGVLYENFLIDATFNRLARNKYYLSSPLFENNKERKVLKWLN